MSKETLLLLALIEQGICVNTSNLEVLQTLGLWHLSDDQQCLIASKLLLDLRQSLPTSQDTVAAIFATQATYQTAWSNIVAAQLKDAGSRNDEQALIEQISQLSDAAESVLNQLDNASLQATNFIEVESLAFGQAAEQSASYPKLLRALASAVTIKKDEKSAIELTKIDSDNISSTWQINRLIRVPDITSISDKADQYLLTGNVEAIGSEIDKQSSLAWLLKTPWAYLLAHVAYAQDVWRSEQIAGGLRLEIDPTQAKHFMQPSKIQVIVTTRDDVEVSCGTLAELLLRVLDNLSISLFTELAPKQQVAKLDAVISPIIGYMVEAKVWQFIQGSSKDIPHYQIHPQFEPIPNTRLGTINFARPGQHITAAIREQAEHWAVELSGQIRSVR
ncbi:hypothetical protein [Psychromonas arctica]|uniref:hypothetical protein n=1 Tax=Psychromonas arctica TaxID=168275 RepID=UPI00048CE0D1